MAEPRNVFEKLAMVIVGFLLVVIVLTYGGYFYKELTYKSRNAARARQYDEQRQRAEREVAAMTIDQLIDAVGKPATDQWEQIQSRLLRDAGLWAPMRNPAASEAEKARLERAITELGAVFYASLTEVVDKIAASDKALQPRLVTALVAGVGRKIDGRGPDVGELLFKKGGAAWLTPAAVATLKLTPGDQAKMGRHFLYDRSPEGRRLLLAWLKEGFVTASPDFPESLVTELKSSRSDWEADATPEERAFAKELEAAEKAAAKQAKPTKPEKKP